MKKLKSNETIGYASAFVSFVLPRLYDIKEIVLFGEVEFDYGGEKPYKNPQFEIVDLTIDLTPEAEDLPRKIMGFELSDGGRKITFDVLFNEEADEYWKHYGNESEVERIVSTNLMKVLREAEEVTWESDWKGAWSVTK